MFGSRNRTARANDGVVTNDRHTKHALPLHLLRVLQFLSALTAFILFTIRLAKIIRLSHRASHSNGAVEGILAAAVLYTIIATLLQLCIRSNHFNPLRWLLVLGDILFTAAFIIVAILTSPKRHGSSAPCTGHSYGTVSNLVGKHASGYADCRLPWGTFILAIISTLLHAATAIFHTVRDRKNRNAERGVGKHEQYNGDAGVHQGNAVGGNTVGNHRGDVV